MAGTFASCQLAASVAGKYSKLDSSSRFAAVNQEFSLRYDAAIATGLIDTKLDKTGTVTDTTGVSVDLAGDAGNKDAFGETVAFNKVHAILIKNNETTAGRNLVIGGAASNGFATPFGDASDKLVIGPGGAVLLTSPLDGYAVTADTGDLLKIAAGGSYSVSYDVTVIGKA